MSYAWGSVDNAADKCKQQGNDLYKVGKHEEALACYRQGLQSTHALPENASRTALQAALHLNAAAALLGLKRPRRAKQECTRALQISPNNAKAFFRRALASISLGEIESAESDLEEARRRQVDVSSAARCIAEVRANEARLSEAIGHMQEGDFSIAIDCLSKAFAVAERAGALEQGAHCCSYLGIANMQMDKWESAAEWHMRHAAMSEQFEDLSEQSRALGNLGSCYQMMGRHDKAIECHQRQMSVAGDVMSQVDLCAMHGNMAIAYRSLMQFDLAIVSHEKCLQIATDIGDEGLRGITYSNLGLTYRKMGDLTQSLRCHKKSLVIAQNDDNNASLAREFDCIGCVEGLLGHHTKALESFQRELAILEGQSDVDSEVARVNGNMGICHAQLGDFAKAITCFQKHLEAVVDGEQEVQSVTNLAMALQDMGKVSDALECRQRQVELAHKSGDALSKGYALGGLGGVYALMEDYHKSLGCYRDALRQAREGGDAMLKAVAMVCVGVVLVQCLLFEEAASILTQALQALEDVVGDSGGRQDILEPALQQMSCCYRALQLSLLSRPMHDEDKSIIQALEYALQNQGLEMILAMAHQGVIDWDFDDAMDNHEITWAMLRGLPERLESTVLVLSPLDAAGTLAAFVLMQGCSVPTCKIFGPVCDDFMAAGGTWAAVLHKLCAAAGPAQGGSSKESGKQDRAWSEEVLLRILYQCCWEPISELVGEGERVVISVQGDLVLVPWVAILDARGHRLGDSKVVTVEPCVQLLLGSMEEGRTKFLNIHVPSVVVGNDTLRNAYVVGAPQVNDIVEMAGLRRECDTVSISVKGFSDHVHSVMGDRATLSCLKQTLALPEGSSASWLHFALPVSLTPDLKMHFAEGEQPDGEKDDGCAGLKDLIKACNGKAPGSTMVLAARLAHQKKTSERDLSARAMEPREWLALSAMLRMCGAVSVVMPMALMPSSDVDIIMTSFYTFIDRGLSVPHALAHAHRHLCQDRGAGGLLSWSSFTHVGLPVVPGRAWRDPVNKKRRAECETGLDCIAEADGSDSD